MAQLPERIQNLEAEQVQLTALISDPKAFQRNQDQGSQALQRLQVLAEELDSGLRALGIARQGERREQRLSGVSSALAARSTSPQQIAGIRQPRARGVGDDQGRGLLTAHLLQFAHGLLDSLLRGWRQIFPRPLPM